MYALEWYDVPRKDYGTLVEYHPYLTKGDAAKLNYLNFEHMGSHAAIFCLLSLMSNRFLLRRQGKFFQKFMQQKYLRAPVALSMGLVTTYAVNLGIMRQIYFNDMKELGFEKYFELDLDADMMREDLQQMGINIEAKHFVRP